MRSAKKEITEHTEIGTLLWWKDPQGEYAGTLDSFKVLPSGLKCLYTKQHGRVTGPFPVTSFYRMEGNA